MKLVYFTLTLSIASLFMVSTTSSQTPEILSECLQGEELTRIATCSQIIDLTSGEVAATDLIDVYYMRGTTYLNDRKFELAIADFSEVISMNPDHFRAYNYRGSAYSDYWILKWLV